MKIPIIPKPKGIRPIIGTIHWYVLAVVTLGVRKRKFDVYLHVHYNR